MVGPSDRLEVDEENDEIDISCKLEHDCGSVDNEASDVAIRTSEGCGESERVGPTKDVDPMGAASLNIGNCWLVSTGEADSTDELRRPDEGAKLRGLYKAAEGEGGNRSDMPS